MASDSALGLRLPERLHGEGRDFFLQPKAVQEWITRLPMANIGETSRRVFKTIVEFNRAELPPRTRIDVAEQFRHPIHYLSESLEKRYIDAGLPLSSKNRKIAALNRELLNELAMAYKLAVEQIARELPESKSDRALLLALYRAIDYLSQELLHSAMVYAPYPPYVWREIHSLYVFAARRKLEQVVVKEKQPNALRHGDATIRDLYKQALLFALTAPYRLRQREIRRVYDRLPDWVGSAHLRPSPPHDREHYLFRVRFKSDEPAQHLSLPDRRKGERFVVLDTTDLIRTLRQVLEQSRGESNDAKALPRPLLRALIQAWTACPPRAYTRTRLNFELRVAVGLAAVHALLRGDTRDQMPRADDLRLLDERGRIEEPQSRRGSPAPLPQSDPDGRYSLAPIDGVREVRRRGFEEFGPGSRDEVEPEAVRPDWGGSRVQHGSYETFTFATVNESAGGYCLEWSGDAVPAVRVGELIGIQSATDSARYGIGVVRWIRSAANETMHVGVQVLSPDSDAVCARLDGVGDKADKHCLLLPEIKASGTPATLVCPTYPFTSGSRVKLNDGIRERRVRLVKMIESTGAFSQFQFTYLDLGDDPEGEGGEGHEKFDNLWSSI